MNFKKNEIITRCFCRVNGSVRKNGTELGIATSACLSIASLPKMQQVRFACVCVWERATLPESLICLFTCIHLNCDLTDRANRTGLNSWYVSVHLVGGSLFRTTAEESSDISALIIERPGLCSELNRPLWEPLRLCTVRSITYWPQRCAVTNYAQAAAWFCPEGTGGFNCLYFLYEEHSDELLVCFFFLDGSVCLRVS